MSDESIVGYAGASYLGIGDFCVTSNTPSLRDYFAAAALSGGLEQGARSGGTADWWHRSDQIAKRAYEIADAMIKESSKKHA